PRWSGLDPDRGRRSLLLGMSRMHLDHVVDREERQRHPDRRCRRSADLEHGETDDAEGQQDLAIDVVVGGRADLPLELLEEIDGRSGALGVARKELCLLLDLAGEFVELSPGGFVSAHTMSMMTMEMIVELVVLIRVVV